MNRNSSQRMPQPQQKLFVKVSFGLDDVPAEFKLRDRVLTQYGSKLEGIRIRTKAEVTVGGSDGEPGSEAGTREPVYIGIEHANLMALQTARQMAECVVESVRQDFEKFTEEQRGNSRQVSRVTPNIRGSSETSHRSSPHRQSTAGGSVTSNSKSPSSDSRLIRRYTPDQGTSKKFKPNEEERTSSNEDSKLKTTQANSYFPIQSNTFKVPGSPQNSSLPSKPSVSPRPGFSSSKSSLSSPKQVTAQSVARPIKWPTAQPTAQPMVKPPLQPIAQPPVQPIRLQTAQPTAQPMMQPAVQPIAQPPVQPIRLPTAQPIVQPAVQPIVHPPVQPIKWPTTQPTAQPIVQPAVQPIVHPPVQPIKWPTTQPTAQPMVQPPLQPNAQPMSNFSQQESTTSIDSVMDIRRIIKATAEAAQSFTQVLQQLKASALTTEVQPENTSNTDAPKDKTSTTNTVEAENTLQFSTVFATPHFTVNSNRGLIKILVTPRSDESLYASIAHHLFGPFRRLQELEVAAITLHRRAANYVRKNKERFFNQVKDFYKDVDRGHRLDDEMAFQCGCVALQSNHQTSFEGQKILLIAIATMFNQPICIYQEISQNVDSITLDKKRTVIFPIHSVNKIPLSIVRRRDFHNRYETVLFFVPQNQMSGCMINEDNPVSVKATPSINTSKKNPNPVHNNEKCIPALVGSTVDEISKDKQIPATVVHTVPNRIPVLVGSTSQHRINKDMSYFSKKNINHYERFS